jgi:murein DD-endopeptidase MepM/ murein hydrolase activator NlpD
MATAIRHARSPGRCFAALLGALCALAATCAQAADAALLRVTATRAEQTVQLHAENFDRVSPRWAILNLTEASNLRAEPELPARFVLAPGERRLVATLHPVSATQSTRYGYRYTHGTGDPTRAHDESAVYLLPWAHGGKHTLTQGYFGKATHAGTHALDFDLPAGTAVHAARAGIVRTVRDDAVSGGSYAPALDGNFVEILHEDATWAVYAHLKPGGVAVRPGQRVAAGERIGYSGATGRASGPHLHFVVYRADWSDKAASVPTRFRVAADEPSEAPVEGRTYYAYHPGGAPFASVLGAALREEDLRRQKRPVPAGEFRVRQERIDQRVLIWASNGTSGAVDSTVSVEEARDVTTSAPLPYRAVVPARTEVFLFFVDLTGSRPSFRVSTRFRRAPEGVRNF